MERKNNIKILAIILCMIVVVILLGFRWYKYIQNKKQTEIIATANKDMNDGGCYKHIAILEEYVKEKYDISIEKGIDFANELKRIKAIYEDGINLFNEKGIQNQQINLKKFLMMIKDAQSKIEKCKKQYIEKNIDQANKCLDDVLNMDSTNNRAKELKKSIEDVIKENGIDYYIVNVVDDMETHFATRLLYYVEVSTSKVYKLNIVLNKLNPID